MTPNSVPLRRICYNLAYPALSHITQDVQLLSYAQRSWLIKCCQAQRLPHSLLDDTTLYRLSADIPPFLRLGVYYPILEFFNHHPLPDIPPSIIFPILIDCLRGIPFSDPMETELARSNSISNEISLSENTKVHDPNIDFSIFFNENNQSRVLHPSLPPIPPNVIQMVNTRMRAFRHSLEDSLLYARYTHKNMSRSTRRDAAFLDIDLDDVPIFGQDNWIQLYHETGVKLGGICEMRQKIYPSNLKPRTYYAMGGIVYDKCRFLSTILIKMCDMFIPTHRRWKLRADRLTNVSDLVYPEQHYHVYDLSSFTSNFTNQRAFTRELQKFFSGVFVRVVDEYLGPISMDLGDMFQDYIDTCSEYPEVSYERVGYDDESAFPFGSGSLLGIFGNMPLATLAHFLIVFSVIHDEAKLGIAGDDGAVFTDGTNGQDIYKAIHLVGDCVPEKTFDSFEDSCIFLKRPLLTDPVVGSLSLATAYIPPCVAASFLSLSDDHYDERYHSFPKYLSINERVSIIGVDLLRYLSSIFMSKSNVDVGPVREVYRGFCRLVHHYVKFWPLFGIGGNGRYVWPADPMSYEFWDIHPLSFIHLYGPVSTKNVCNLEFVPPPVEWLIEGRMVRGNMTPELRLARMLGYITMEREYVEKSGEALMHYEMMTYGYYAGPQLKPVYDIVIVKEMPEWLVSLIRH